MTKRKTFVGAVLACALLASCGGGGGSAEGTVVTDGTSVSGSFAACEPVGAPIAFASMQTRVVLTTTSLGFSVRHFLGTRCSGPALVTISSPVILLAGDGTQTVGGPVPGSSVLALKVNMSRGAGQVTWEGNNSYLRVSGNRLQVIEPNTGTVLYGEDISLPSLSEKSLIALVGDRVYLGNTTYDSQGYPTGLDFSSGWDRL